ncbi:hypothetical protein PROFUN_10464 [Planoprotostelium fungivorum]|uniref:Major facilitator superfamily (MFS) profile domain-containing protein n=1 Tax=Planoprotostelium fungivorum TaxID=1890364 RepID=A0A2P6NDE2_9EUKA|nr:hypothetical protein PROFUN_10464 [Planoprotostelium fungivorum]
MYGWLIAATAALGGLVIGYEIGVVSRIMVPGPFMNYFGLGTNEWMLDPKEAWRAAWVPCSFLLGCTVGALLVAYPSSQMGRKWTMFLGSSLFLVGVIFEASAFPVWMLYFGRVASGLGVGVMSATIPLYISETSESHVRGRLGTAYQFMITVGIFLATITNLGVYRLHTDERWRISFALQSVPCVFMMFALVPLPNSPRWLIQKGDIIGAKSVIAKLRGRNALDPEVHDRFLAIKHSIDLEGRLGGGSWRDLLFGEDIRHRTWLAVTLQVCQQMSCINFILYYGAALWDDQDRKHAIQSWMYELFIGCYTATNIIATIPSMWLIERLGRRWLLILGGLGMSMSYGTAIIASIVFPPEKSSYIVFAALVVTDIFFASTWGPVVWVYVAEIFPLRYRAKGTSLATSANWMTNAVVSIVGPIVFSKLHLTYTLMIPAACTFFMSVYALVVVPETKGRTLEEINEIFNSLRMYRAEESGGSGKGLIGTERQQLLSPTAAQ